MNQEMTVKGKFTYWWVPLIFGAIFIATGIWILRAPAESFEKITMFIGIIILVSGTSGLFLTIYNRRAIPGWGYQLAGGILDMAIGLILILNPAILLKIITVFAAIWLAISGFRVLRRAFEFREGERDIWRWEMILGIVLLLLAILLLWHPMVLGFTIAIWTAAAFIALGIFRISLTLQLRNLSSKTD
jgi:uncharacterized membrane protein HdeD (DUF308 family)